MKTLRELMDLTGRRALVSGGAGHIALAVEEALLELGASVALLDATGPACRDRGKELERFDPNRILSWPCDLGSEDETRQATRGLVHQWGGLDIFIHCAAFVGTTPFPGWAVPFEEQTVDAWEAALRVNLTSAFVIVQEARSALEKSGRGSVILFASTYGLVAPDWRIYEGTGLSNPPAYGASKGGLLQLMRYLSTLLAPKIRVNAITPGGLLRGQPSLFVSRYGERTPLGRMSTEEDLKGAVAFLAGDQSAYVTGHNLVVDGGWTVW